ncbi:aminopeptidase [Niveibacterium umoris]|uniref:Putative aminopeptidase n=1 Tax=Niveibacterium umoris TaxID=1193620 RepID=A0A840BLW8_9RHOO|nr:aminopeptidase [Niveibacterium umoris]MBB4014551.1 putative aminopeptidase [Niveibacterium umoris]
MLFPLLAVLLSGCAVSPSYYWQAASGQLDLLARSRPIDDVLQDAATPAALREQLQRARQVRRFASDALALPDNRSYSRYTALDRPFVSWNVFAADPLSMRLKEWCVPVAGCIGYLGYFDKADADARAAELRTQGFEVYVGGVPAYSTLGWFSDPLLSTFIAWPETEFARLLFHELTHQVAYVKDDTEFNESFATAVEEVGVLKWMGQPGKDGLRAGFDRAQAMRADFRALVLKYRGELQALYAGDLPPADKLARKAALIAALGDEYRQIKAERWNGYAGYDRWFAQPINNALLASVGVYTGKVPAFAALLGACGGDLPRFYREVKRLAALPLAERKRALTAAVCPS